MNFIECPRCHLFFLPKDGHVCKICEFCGKTHLDMKKHLKTHRDEMTVKCPDCGLICQDEEDLENHLPWCQGAKKWKKEKKNKKKALKEYRKSLLAIG